MSKFYNIYNSFKDLISDVDNELFKDYLNDFKIMLKNGWFNGYQDTDKVIKLFKRECKKRGINYEEV